MTSEEEILRKLDEIESRLSGLESGNGSKKIMIEERTEISEEGNLESSEMAKENSKIVKTKRILVCDYCGKQITAISSICKKCGKKLCEKCSIDFRRQVICPQDLRSVYPLSRTAFKVLLMVANGITSTGLIHRISGISGKEAKDIIRYLWNAGFVEKSIFSGLKISETGLEAISAYGQLFGREDAADMRQLDEGVKRYVIQRP